MGPGGDMHRSRWTDQRDGESTGGWANLSAPRLVIGAAYQHTGEEMKFLWNKDTRINTVHVRYVEREMARRSAARPHA